MSVETGLERTIAWFREHPEADEGHVLTAGETEHILNR